MNYSDGTRVTLGDLVMVPVGEDVSATARVVMLGDTYEHLPIEDGFLSFILRDKILKSTAIAIEWVEQNSFAHDDPRYAQVGDYMTTEVDEEVRLVEPNPTFQRTATRPPN